MVSWLNKALDDVINTIINSDDYKSCILLEEKMSTNKEICELVEKIKIVLVRIIGFLLKYEYIFMDEPFGTIDFISTEYIMRLLKNIEI